MRKLPSKPEKFIPFLPWILIIASIHLWQQNLVLRKFTSYHILTCSQFVNKVLLFKNKGQTTYSIDGVKRYITCKKADYSTISKDFPRNPDFLFKKSTKE